MTEQEVSEKIKSILASEFEIDSSALKPETNLFTELDLDSIDAIDLVVRIQQETGKKVDPAEFREIRTFADVVKSVTKLINS